MGHNMNTLIVCHAGAGLGLGHMARALVVARALREELGAGVCFLIQGDPIQRPDLDQFEHHFIDSSKNLSEVISHHARQVSAWVIVLDLHPCLVPQDIDDLLKALRQEGRKVIGVDDSLCHCYNLDMLFIPAFQCSLSRNTYGTPPIVFGWDCFLLNVKRSPVVWKPGRYVLALTGGSDATGLGKTFPTLLNETLSDDTELHWVTGPYAQPPVWPSSSSFYMLNHQAPAGLDDLMVSSTYAVTVYGVSFFELLYYGVPTVVFSPYGGKDDAELAAIAEAGIAVVAEDEIEAVEKLKELMTNDATAVALSQKARHKLSVFGGHTFAQAVAALLAD